MKMYYSLDDEVKWIGCEFWKFIFENYINPIFDFFVNFITKLNLFKFTTAFKFKGFDNYPLEFIFRNPHN